ncbi:zinc finger protein ZFP2-like isoform X2 [Cydia pomonella]|uniref:zinc finger protein ZFP2-like isoform X2 n=1 Tax=Cydia pomonella TaxID=82600 RepID=UPI002ADD9B93|nr:zinc finger protein ZFP2-like isoform X2 [Cydia pomonella]
MKTSPRSRRNTTSMSSYCRGNNRWVHYTTLYPAFEKEYNFDVVILSREQQVGTLHYTIPRVREGIQLRCRHTVAGTTGGYTTLHYTPRSRRNTTSMSSYCRGNNRWVHYTTLYPAFEKEYNFDVVILSPEQQIEDMASRKEKDNYMNSQFKCEKCFKGFYTEATLANHDSKHHDEAVGPHSCELCLCRFRIPAILRRHLATHRLRFVCQHCGFTARDRSHAMTHSKEHKGLRYECQYCGDTFKKRSTYGTHVRIQHPNQNKSCDVCGETFLGALGLALHKKKSHRQAVEAGAAPCAQCGVCFESEYARARHSALAARGCQHARACALCGENFKDEAALQAHVRERHQDRQTQCQECDMTFASEASRSVHYERVHLKVKVRRCLPKTGRKYDRYGDHFMCEMCGKKCQNNIALKYHIRSHTGEKPHACPHCPKHYSTPVALQTHLLKHTGERPFKCELCGKAFTQKTMLQKHKTVHTGEKPYACDICGKAFTQSGSVHTHVKYVHKKLPAPPRNRGKRDKPD